MRIAVIVVMLAVPTASMRSAYADEERPPLSGARIFGEALLGTMFGLAGGIGGAALAYGVDKAFADCPPDGVEGNWDGQCGVAAIYIGGFVGLTVAAPVGVYLVGSAHEQSGSLAMTIGASAMGSLLGVMLASRTDTDAAALPLLVLPPVAGAVLGFNATRKYDDPQLAPVLHVSRDASVVGIAGRF